MKLLVELRKKQKSEEKFKPMESPTKPVLPVMEPDNKPGCNTILGRMQTSTTCSTCQGTGEVIGSKPNGADAQGLMVTEETVTIQIPAGVTEGVQLKVGGKEMKPGKKFNCWGSACRDRRNSR